ncbi:sugar phosphate isomerase/epimerase family protein [Gynurincola endophyticus]|uniref:sugar phosphate isomerase/epimerase family protein n=1 Tax=Gynurincola endophyticus TaxID=2479004 RepID=UPI000F8CD29C|nr:sugar phosphate isomerase/epimerase [Gynurincola endophyticus]
MKIKWKSFIAALAMITTIVSCGEQPSKEEKTAVETGTTPDWKLGVQLWTFNHFDMQTALLKVDSAAIRYVEAYLGQPFGFGETEVKFGVDITDAQLEKLNQLLKEKNIKINAFGVVVPANGAEWIKTFELAKKIGVSYITAEPIKAHLDTVNLLAGEYGIPVAIHDHPYPNEYAHPDSVINAMQGRNHLYACADIGHWARNGLNVVECLQKLEGRILGVHLKDVSESGNTKAEDVVVGTGVIPMKEVFAELKRQGFKGQFSIERENNWWHNLEDVIATKKLFDELSK